jgi:hypothetical protein
MLLINTSLITVLTAKETEERAAADRDGGVTNGGRMAQLRLRGARRTRAMVRGGGGALHAQHLREGPTGSEEAPGTTT